MTEIMPEDRERIWAYVRNDLPMWETEPAIGAIPYVRASIADEHRRQRDRLLDAYLYGTPFAGTRLDASGHHRRKVGAARA